MWRARPFCSGFLQDQSKRWVEVRPKSDIVFLLYNSSTVVIMQLCLRSDRCSWASHICVFLATVLLCYAWVVLPVVLSSFSGIFHRCYHCTLPENNKHFKPIPLHQLWLYSCSYSHSLGWNVFAGENLPCKPDVTIYSRSLHTCTQSKKTQGCFHASEY